MRRAAVEAADAQGDEQRADRREGLGQRHHLRMRKIGEAIAAENLQQVHEQDRADDRKDSEKLRIIDRDASREPIEREQAGAEYDGQIARSDDARGDANRHWRACRARASCLRHRRVCRGGVANRIPLTRHLHYSKQKPTTVVSWQSSATPVFCLLFAREDCPCGPAREGVTLLSVFVTLLGPRPIGGGVQRRVSLRPRWRKP